MRVALLMAMFHALILRDGFSPQTIHDEFLKIKEYRQFIAPDVKGAEAD